MGISFLSYQRPTTALPRKHLDDRQARLIFLHRYDRRIRYHPSLVSLERLTTAHQCLDAFALQREKASWSQAHQRGSKQLTGGTGSPQRQAGFKSSGLDFNLFRIYIQPQ